MRRKDKHPTAKRVAKVITIFKVTKHILPLPAKISAHFLFTPENCNFAQHSADMGRILAIDYGTKRTGIAVSDPMRIIANALETVPTHELRAFLAKYIAANDVDIIVVGMPRRMDGTPSETFEQIGPLVKWLRKEFPAKEVVLHDERFTSVLAQQAIRDSGVRKMARRDKALVDRVSATIILQGYMESLNYKNSQL